MLIGGFQKSSLIDYKGKIAAVVFTTGCNFSCPYCHNPELVCLDNRFYGAQNIQQDDIISFLKTRQNKLDGVVITGGEPTLHKDLGDFIKKIKDLNFLVKLDTNGSNPSVIRKYMNEGLIDYIAMDIKTSFDDYKKVIGHDTDIDKIKETADIIINGAVDYEFRTTVVCGLLTYDSFVKINDTFKKAAFDKKVKRYYLQKFQPSKHIDKSYVNQSAPSDDELEKIKEIFNKTVEYISVR